MDTLKNSRGTPPALIVDWDHVNAFGDYEDWVTAKYNFDLAVVLLVPNPFGNDFEDNATFEPTVVLRNHGRLTDFEFKKQALGVIRDMSNLVPVAAWDDDPEVLQMYRLAGVPFTGDLGWDASH